MKISFYLLSIYLFFLSVQNNFSMQENIFYHFKEQKKPTNAIKEPMQVSSLKNLCLATVGHYFSKDPAMLISLNKDQKTTAQQKITIETVLDKLPLELCIELPEYIKLPEPKRERALDGVVALSKNYAIKNQHYPFTAHIIHSLVPAKELWRIERQFDNSEYYFSSDEKYFALLDRGEELDDSTILHIFDTMVGDHLAEITLSETPYNVLFDNNNNIWYTRNEFETNNEDVWHNWLYKFDINTRKLSKVLNQIYLKNNLAKSNRFIVETEEADRALNSRQLSTFDPETLIIETIIPKEESQGSFQFCTIHSDDSSNERIGAVYLKDSQDIVVIYDLTQNQPFSLLAKLIHPQCSLIIQRSLITAATFIENGNSILTGNSLAECVYLWHIAIPQQPLAKYSLDSFHGFGSIENLLLQNNQIIIQTNNKAIACYFDLSLIEKIKQYNKNRENIDQKPHNHNMVKSLVRKNLNFNCIIS